jgi:hypothetical protein
MYRFQHGFSAIHRPEIILQSKDSIWPGAVGAFLGAFFAFIFGLITFYLQKKLERYWKHKNAVVEIEHLLNDHLNDSAGNQYLLQGAIDTLKRHHMTYTLLNQFRMPEDMDLRLGDIDILNAFADYKEPVIKLNNGLTSWQGLNDRLQQNIIANPGMPAPIVHKNMEHIQKQAEALVKFLLGLDEDTKRFLAFIRIYMRKDKHIWSIWLLKKKNGDKPIISKGEIDTELKTLETEIAEISKVSRERIAKIMGN